MPENSPLVIEELFAAGDPSFQMSVRTFASPKKLLPFADRWLKDSRAWSREQLASYVDNSTLDPRHRPLVRRLFKSGEAAADDEVMGWFLVAFDRSVRRRIRTRYDWQTSEREEYLRANPSRGGFKIHTRNYLRRRAWRYFRRLGYGDPARYLKAVLGLLPRYRDEDADSGVHFIDNWGLVHILFHHAPILKSRAYGWFVLPGRELRELKPGPAFPEAWKNAQAELFDLMVAAGARAVRRTALAMLKARPDWAAKIPFERVVRLLEHEDAELQAVGVELLQSAAGLESVPIDLWLRLLASQNMDVLQAVCDLMARLVSPEKLSTEQLLGFACGPVAPVARLGFDWLKSRTLSPAEVLELAQVASAPVAKDAVALARERLGAEAEFNPEWVLTFLDAKSPDVRRAAWTWFSEEKRARHRLDLWAKIVETPYDDIQIGIVRHLKQFADIDTALRVLLARAPLETIWATVLLNVHRGNRAKRLAASQIADAIEREPKRAPDLLPLLAVAARSIRAPEFRAGLAAVVRTVVSRPEVADAVRAHFPELRLAT